MTRLRRAVILADLASCMEKYRSWCGETHIQKAVYFLQKLGDVPTGYFFILYKHGPFSFDLRDEITELRAYNLFKLEPRQVPYGPSLKPTVNAELLKKRFSKTLSGFKQQIEFVASSLDGKGVAELERLATALYVTLNSDSEEDAEVRAQKINSLKPHVSLEEAVAAIGEVDKMRKEAVNLLGGIKVAGKRQ